jgi:chromosome partitioning protein
MTVETTVIAVDTEKGGTGKTTTACNLAAGLALKERYEGGGSVVLVDLDPQGDAAKFWGVYDRVYHEDNNPDGPCVSDVLLGETAVGDALIPLRDNLYLLPASQKLKDAEYELVMREALAAGGRGRRGHVPLVNVLEQRLAPLMGLARWIVIDCAPHLGPLEPAVFNFADWVVAPVQLQYLSTAGVSQHTETLDKWAERGQAKSKLMFILPTMVSLRDGATWQVGERQMLQTVARAYPGKVLSPVPDSVLVEQSPGHHQSIFEYAGRHEAPVRAYANLVEKVYHYAH